MTLSEQLFFMMQKNQEAMQLTDLVTGTVTGVSPLQIKSDASMAPYRREVLYLTESVVEKKIPILSHTHHTGGLVHSHFYNALPTSESLDKSYVSTEELADIEAMENGKPLPVRDGYIILNRGLEVGDRVLLLRVQHGQKFIVLSRIFE